ncbi:Scr1 family TA system antitoxin-like transcriptional regulator [Streptomyces sp. NBC_00286]|uniref:Scr1 family TA system antitoxin-like transcriptional regulator n=1 Tax=Streptomyces sp. NBC_00286 TaxID=2975701 RepID=UPI003FA6D086
MNTTSRTRRTVLRTVMRAQLMEVSRLPNVTVQVVPFEAGAHSAYGRAFATFDGGRVPGVRSRCPVTVRRYPGK